MSRAGRPNLAASTSRLFRGVVAFGAGLLALGLLLGGGAGGATSPVAALIHAGSPAGDRLLGLGLLVLLGGPVAALGLAGHRWALGGDRRFVLLVAGELALLALGLALGGVLHR